jgi:predicted ArsR family transcriptional regulator
MSLQDEKGATVSETADELDIGIETAKSVIADLAASGMVVDSGLRRAGANGEPEIVWLTTAEGKLAAGAAARNERNGASPHIAGDNSEPH